MNIEKTVIALGGRIAKLEHKMKYIANITDPPSIEQELESGLEALPGNKHYTGYPRICTRIFLPAAKYEEWVSFCVHTGLHNTDTFHDISVFSYSGETIVYCTD